MSTDSGILDEAYERFQKTGPEFGGFLSNHGPMAVEAMVRHGHADAVHRWADEYSRRLEDAPRGLTPVTEETWREALGDYSRVADWTTYFTREVADHEWRDVLAVWWPRLLPGIVAGATHAVIRVGHAVQTLLADSGRSEPSDPDGPRVVELAHALAYWAARWQAAPGETTGRTGLLTPAEALAGVPLVADQTNGVSYRVPQLATTAGWPEALNGLTAAANADEARSLIAGLADAATLRYLTHGHGDAVLLVHAATAPTAVLRTLPALPSDLWLPSLDAAWSASAVVTATFSPRQAADADDLAPLAHGQWDAEETMARAVIHGDEHAIKFADTALDVHARTGDANALGAAVRATLLIDAVHV